VSSVWGFGDSTSDSVLNGSNAFYFGDAYMYVHEKRIALA